MISAHHSVTSKIAHFLYRLLRPCISNIIEATIFMNESDFIQKLNHYCHTDHHLHPTTIFTTIKITNFHTMVSHTSMVQQLGYFFMDYSARNKLECTSIISNKPHYLSVATIQQLITLFYEHNIFYYDGKIYGFTRGSPNSLLLSELLSSMYLFIWQKQVFAPDPRFKTELCGR